MAKTDDKDTSANRQYSPSPVESQAIAQATLQAGGTQDLLKRAETNAQPRAGILDLVKEQDARETEPQKHTFGAWVRAKGVSLDKVREAVKEGRVSGSGDGPIMTEKEFDEAVGFQVVSNLTNVPIIMQHHVPADQISEGREGRSKREV